MGCTSPLSHLLKRLGDAVGLDMGVPVLLPAVTFPAHLALERLQAHVLVHVLLQIFGFVEPLIATVEERKQTETAARALKQRGQC